MQGILYIVASSGNLEACVEDQIGNRTLLQIGGPSSIPPFMFWTYNRIPVVAKGPESAKQARLHSLGLERDRELSMRAHTPRKSQKELQYS